jgi:hypothetical protein
MKIIFLGFFFRLSLVVFSTEIFSLPGGDADALNFHLEALQFSNYYDQKELSPGLTYDYKTGWYYSVFLGYLYSLFGTTSHLFSSIISCFFWFLSAIIFRKIALKLKIKKNNINIAILLYAFAFPTAAAYSIFTLREVYLLFFLNLFALQIVNIYYAKEIKKIFLYLLYIIVILFFLTLLHKSTPYFLGIFLVIAFLYFIIKKLNIDYFFIILLAIPLIFFLEYNQSFEFVLNALKDQQMGHAERMDARATYLVLGNIKDTDYDIINLAFFALNNLYNYLFQPTFYYASNAKDMILIYENFLRLFLLSLILSKFFLKFEKNSLFTILMLIIFVMEVIYAQATVNWGTASRHHVPTIGILILLYFFPLKKTK